MSNHNKIRIKLATLVAEPNYVMQAGRPVIVGYKFPDAMHKLADDPMPIKDRYAVGRAAKQVAEVVRIYDKARHELIEKLGKKQSAMLQAELEEMKAKFDAKAPEMAGAAAHARMKSIEDTIRELIENPQLDNSRIPETDRKAMADFEEQLKALQAEEVEIEHLAGPVTLHAESRLTGNEMALLADTIVKPPAQ